MNQYNEDNAYVDSDEKGFIPSTDDELEQHEEEVEVEAGPVELEGGDIEVVNAIPASVVRIARAVELSGGVVSNILRIPVDADDNPVGFQVPYGTELLVVDDVSPIEIGWLQIDEEFVNPDE